MAIALIHPLQIGPVTLANNLALAPMAGTTELAFRRICRCFGAGLTVTELVSATGICHDKLFKRNWRYLVIDPAEVPVAIQLFGGDPNDFSRAISRILEHPILGQCSLIDLNMGCPVTKVVGRGEGAALMKTPDLAARIIEASVKAAAPFGKPVTVKFRKGWDDEMVNTAAFAHTCEEAGASALTIHGRTRKQMYSGHADWSAIGEAKSAVRIPVFGNGDIDSPTAARRMLHETGVDGLMIGRAAQGNPWLFQWLVSALADPTGNSDTQPVITPAEKIPVILEHLDGLIAQHGEAIAIREMRKQLVCYFRGARQGAILKNKAMAAQNREEVAAVLEEWPIY
jgi:tRNA-dihydrouridine synthase B